MARKYRQPGYMDSDEREKREKRDAPRGPRETLGPRTPQMPGQRTVSRCAQCGTVLPVTIKLFGQCPRCQFELHSCKQCLDRKSTRLNSSHIQKSRMPSSA